MIKLSSGVLALSVLSNSAVAQTAAPSEPSAASSSEAGSPEPTLTGVSSVTGVETAEFDP